MTKTINKTTIAALFLQLFSCSNTKTIECYSVDEDAIVHTVNCCVQSIITGKPPFNYTVSFKCKSGNAFEYEFKNVNGLITLNTNTFSRSINQNNSYRIIDSLFADNQKLYILFEEGIELNENRRVVCANGIDQIYGLRYGDGTPKIYLYNKDTILAKRIANILIHTKSLDIARHTHFQKVDESRK